MKTIVSHAIAVAAIAALAACSSTPPRQAQKKAVDVAGQKIEFGGQYDEQNNSLSVTVNGDPMMTGKFPPYTATMRMNTKFRGLDITADCYFASVLGNKGGRIGIVAGLVQSGIGKGADKCDMLVGGKVVESLFF